MLAFSPRTKALFIALGIFVLGTICGIIGERWALLGHQPPPWAEGPRMGGPPAHMGDRPFDRMADRMLERWTNRLDLTADQQKAIAEILRDSREEIGQIRKRISEEMRSQEDTVRDKIQAVLTPEQRKKFDATMRRMEERMPPDHWRGPPPGGP